MTVQELKAQLDLLPDEAQVRLGVYGHTATLISVGMTTPTLLNCSPSRVPSPIAFLSSSYREFFSHVVQEHRRLELKAMP